MKLYGVLAGTLRLDRFGLCELLPYTPAGTDARRAIAWAHHQPAWHAMLRQTGDPRCRRTLQGCEAHWTDRGREQRYAIVKRTMQRLQEISS